MKIISPVDRLDETDALLAAGANELYGGFVPNDWQEKFSLLVSINQRTFATAQLASWEDLAGVVTRCHDQGATFSLVLNAPFYSDLQSGLLIDYVGEAVRQGVDEIILADLGLLRCLKPIFPELGYHASTLAHLGNAAAVAFYASQGITRAILPRHLSTAEMAAIVAKVPYMRFDAFLLVGKCPNTEGLCTFHHSNSSKRWPCEIPYRLTPQQSVPDVLQRAMQRQGSWSQTDRRHGCGLCALPALKRAGIDGLKLVGRGAPTSQKVCNIILVRHFVSRALKMSDETLFRAEARAAHRQRFASLCSTNVCYYPEFFQEDESL